MRKPRRKNQPVSVDISHARSPCTSWYRCNWWGEILYTEASRLGVVHPFFAPTILDGRVGKFATGQQYSFSPASQHQHRYGSLTSCKRFHTIERGRVVFDVVFHELAAPELKPLAHFPGV